MTKIFQRVLLAILFSLSLIAQAAESGEANSDKNGGASDAKGAAIYDFVRQLEDGHVLVGRLSKNHGRLAYGVLDAQGKEIIPLQFSYIEYLRRFKRFKVTTEAGEVPSRRGYFDEAGNAVVPPVYDWLERISNMGDEPTNIAQRDGKYGYINIVTGRVMIPVEYDALAVDSLTADAQGNGIAIARKGNRRGVLSTDGEILVPFEFDAIGDVSLSGATPAERNGELVQLNFRSGVYTGTSELATQYSSNFMPRPMASINPAPFDGLYVAENYPNMRSAWDAWKEGTLRWVAIPSIQINGKHAYVSFGLFAKAGLPPLPNVLDVSRKRGGFTLMTDVSDREGKKYVSTPFFSFTEKNGSLTCHRCELFDLPVRWHRLPAENPQQFGGIGVALRKQYVEDPGVMVLEVLAKGPAQHAGLRADDMITRIDGNPLAQHTIDQVRDMLRGMAGTEVRLSVERGGAALPNEIVVKRAIVNIR